MSVLPPSNETPYPDPDALDQARQAFLIRRNWIGLMFAIVQCSLFLILVLWLLSRESVFVTLFSKLRPDASLNDARALMAWMGGQEDTVALFSQVGEGGRFNTRELNHYLDVRYWLHWLPFLIILLTFAWGVVSMAIFQFTRISYKTVQISFLKLWIFLILVFGVWGAIHWDSLFSALHYPFFGSHSWRLPADSYSLQLFPEWFWGALGAMVAGIPVLFSLILILLIPGRKR